MELLKDIFKEYKKYKNKQIELDGWVRTNRAQKEFGFINFAINILPKEENTIELHHFPSYIFNENVKYIQYTDTERGLPGKDITVLHKDTENIFETIRTSEKQAIMGIHVHEKRPVDAFG